MKGCSFFVVIARTVQNLRHYHRKYDDRITEFFGCRGFFSEVVKANGDRYRGQNIVCIVCGLNRYLQEESDLPVSILDQNEDGYIIWAIYKLISDCIV